MKAIISLAVLALLNTQQEVNAIQLQADMTFTDDIVKALAEADKAEEAEEAKAAKEPKKEEKKKEEPKKEKKEEKKDEKKKDEKKDDEVPMDNAAIKAYSSVIADAAEDSEPSTPVVFPEIKDVAPPDSRREHAPAF